MKHLKDVSMSYFEHMYFALSMALALTVHAFIPCLFTTYVSDKLSHPKDSE
jgi:hypothetical protein